jgi:hypothetical protein
MQIIFCFSLFSVALANFLRESDARFIRLMTVFAQNRASDFRLKWHVVVFATVVADNIKPLGSVLPYCRFF